MKKLLLLITLIYSFNSFSQIICYEDPDQDKFVSDNAKTINTSSKIKCWWKKGVVNRPGIKGDCSPNDNTVYPNAPEKMDGKDNNCDKNIDEPRFIYSSKQPSNQNYPTLNQLKIKINDSKTHLKLINDSSVYYTITFHPLTGDKVFSLPGRLEKYKTNNNYYNATKKTLLLFNNFTHPNLKRLTAYKIYLSFYENINESAPYIRSAKHYSITGGDLYNPLNKLETYRLRMGLLGLFQVGDSSLGKIGVNGTEEIDGIRFGAKKGKTWCDQFWTWIAIKSSNEKGFLNINPNNVPGYFRDPKRDGMWDLWHEDPAQRIPGVDNQFFDHGRGKKWGDIFYDPELSNPKNGGLGDMLLAPSHVFMFFSYDKKRKLVYTIEGNVSNRAMIRAHSVYEVLPDPRTGEQLPPRKYIGAIGRLKRYMFNQQ